MKSETLQDLIIETEARSLLDVRPGDSNGQHETLETWQLTHPQLCISTCDLASLSFSRGSDRADRFDGAICRQSLDLVSDEDIPWILEKVFQRAKKFVYVSLSRPSRSRPRYTGRKQQGHPRDAAWWLAQLQSVSAQYPHILWKLDFPGRAWPGRLQHFTQSGGNLGYTPLVWILADDRPGNTTQSFGLIKALGWPYKVKKLRFNYWINIYEYMSGIPASRLGLDKRGSGQLTPPWPDVVIATGWRPSIIARWIRRKSRNRTKLVQLARKGGHVAAFFDAVVTCRYCRLPSHNRRIETTAPLTRVDSKVLKEACFRWRHLFGTAPRPRVVLLVGGSTTRFQLPPALAYRMGKEVRSFAEGQGGQVFAITSRRTGSEVTQVLRKELGSSHHVQAWSPKQNENPYLGALAWADVFVVTGESESMLSEAAATGKPVYIYPLPERRLTCLESFKEKLITFAQTPRANRRGLVRAQNGIASICARLIERGIIRPARDLRQFHTELIQRCYARPFGEPLEAPPCQPLQPLNEAPDVARQVRTLLGMLQP